MYHKYLFKNKLHNKIPVKYYENNKGIFLAILFI